MKIIITSLFLYPGKVGGAENYLYNLMSGFESKKNHNEIDLIVNKILKNKYNHVFKLFKNIECKVLLNRGFNDYFLALFVQKFRCYDVVFSPNYITPLLLTKHIKKITTIHDVQYLHFPNFFSRKKRLWLYISHLLTLRMADKVVCISESVKDDLIFFFGERYKDKLVVIHNPIDFDRFNNKSDIVSKKIPDKYIFSVAAQYPHKNLLTLIKAFNKLDEKFGYKLILAGQLGKNLIGGYHDYYEELKDEINKNKENIEVLGYVSDFHLGKLYEKCDLFVFPSIFEGFGMPPVEAMGFGKPTITTRLSSLQEATLNKAIYMDDPYSSDELKEIIEDVIINLDHYTGIFQSIKDQIQLMYKPATIAKQYIKCFENSL